ncbi:MAG TPA: hypothetical protein VGB85_11260 [Nannocystis sp.]|jgi:hypothetical protein
MDDTYLIGFATAIAVAGAIFVASRRAGKLGPKLRDALEQAGGELTLPALTAAVGFKDSFINRGKVIQAIAPLVRSGAVVETDDPAATAKTRLELKRFRLQR